jgi:hypothetical protein
MQVLIDVTLDLEGDERFRFEDARGGPRVKTWEADTVIWSVEKDYVTVWAVQVYSHGGKTKNGTPFTRPAADLPTPLWDALKGALRPRETV